jgi:hypothetical protein
VNIGLVPPTVTDPVADRQGIKAALAMLIESRATAKSNNNFFIAFPPKSLQDFPK